MTTTARVSTNPYIGPHSLQSGDALYGRDQEVGDLLDLLIAERIVLLHSPSGAGKTSLIQARLLSLLHDEGFEVLPIVRLNHEVPPALLDRQPPVNRYVLSALSSLEEGVPADLQRSTSELAGLSLARYVAEWPDLDERPGNEVLVLDQFEEVITADPVDHEAKVAFFADLGATLRDRSIWALFSMREDFVAELEPYLRHVPTRLSTRFRLDLLSVDQALDVVVKPARDAGVDFERGAAVKLVDDLRRVRTQRGDAVVEQLGRHVEPVQLQVSCRQIWGRLERGASHIGLEDIESAGDVNQALAGYYATSVAAVSAETGVSERALRDWFEKELITTQGFRGQVLSGPDSAPGADAQVLQRLTSSHLLRAESRRGAVWYELAHDRLTQPIQEDNLRWRATHLSDLERRASEWDQQGRPDRLLLVGQDLDQAERSPDDPASPLTDLERDYLSGSVRAERQRDDLLRAAVRTRRWLWVAVGLLVLALVAAVLAMSSERTANRESERAERAVAYADRAALAAAGHGQSGFDPQLSLLLVQRAMASAGSLDTAAGRDAVNFLQLALDTSPVAQGLNTGGTEVVTAAWSSDAETVVTADAQGTLRLVDVASGEVLARSGDVGNVESVDIDPADIDPADGARVAVGLRDGSVLLWSTAENAAPARVDGHTSRVYDVAFSPDGTWLASAGADGNVVVTRGGDEVDTFELFFEVNAVAWSADGARVYAVDDTGTLTWWDRRSGEQVDDHTGRHDAFAIDVDVSTDGTMVATGGWDGRTVISRVDGRSKPLEIRTTSGAAEVESVSFTSDGAHLLSLDSWGQLDVIDVETGRSVSTVSSPGQIPTAVAASPKDPALALVATADTAAAIWDIEPGHAGSYLVALERDRDGQLMTAAHQDDTVLFWSHDGQRVVARRQISGASIDAIGSAAFDPDGRYLVHTDSPDRARITPLGGAWPARRLRRDVGVVAVSDSGRFVATGGTDSNVRVWNSRSGRQVTVLKKHKTGVTALDFGEDDELVSVASDGTAMAWDVTNERVLHRMEAEDDALTAVAWSPAGDRIALGRSSGTVELLAPGTWDRVARLTWHTERVYDVEFDVSGERLVSSGGDGYAVIWDAATGTMERAVQQRNPIIYPASFSADGRHLLLGGNGGSPTTVWLDVDELRAVAAARTIRGLTATECRRYLPQDTRCGEE